MKRRGLSTAPAASSRFPNKINLPRIAAVGRHDAMLFRSSGTMDSDRLVINITQMFQRDSDLVSSEYPRTVERSGVRVCPGQFRSGLSYQLGRHLPFPKLRL